MQNIIPKKSLGQHWLHDEATLQAICDAANVRAGDAVLEVGPGLGTLTAQLLNRGAVVTGVEFDGVLASQLKANVEKAGVATTNLTVVQQDILSFDTHVLPAGFKVVANIPYYLTSNLIRVLSESSHPFSTAVLLVQKEVAQRVVAGPGQMSLLSVSAQFYCETSLSVEVPAELFTPPPKVDSQVLVLKRRAQPLFESVPPKQFFRLVKAGFSQKRKTLVNSLSAGLVVSKDEARAMLEAADISAMARAQALSLDDWYALYEVVSQQL